MPSYRIIVNPVAGRGRGRHARAVVEQVFKEAGVPYELSESRAPEEVPRLAYDAALHGYEVVVGVGGDGTTHGIVNGLVRAAQEQGKWDAGRPVGALGVVPVGTGNDFCWRLGVPENEPERACRLLLADHRRLLDLGRVSDEHGRVEIFHNHLGGAFEAATAVESLKIRRLQGLLLYLVAVLRVVPQYTRAPLITLHYNGRVETRPLLLASVANGGRSGGGFKIAPMAQPDDGELDLVLADSPNPLITLWLLPQFLRGTHIHQKRYVKIERTSHVILEAPAGIPVHLDGEIYRTDARRLEIEVLPRRLEVVAAPAGR